MRRRPSFAAAWLNQRLSGVAKTEALERAELAALDDAEALRLADALLQATDIKAASAERASTSGLVEQQRLFIRSSR